MSRFTATLTSALGALVMLALTAASAQATGQKHRYRKLVLSENHEVVGRQLGPTTNTAAVYRKVGVGKRLPKVRAAWHAFVNKKLAVIEVPSQKAEQRELSNPVGLSRFARALWVFRNTPGRVPPTHEKTSQETARTADSNSSGLQPYDLSFVAP